VTSCVVMYYGISRFKPLNDSSSLKSLNIVYFIWTIRWPIVSLRATYKWCNFIMMCCNFVDAKCPVLCVMLDSVLLLTMCVPNIFFVYTHRKLHQMECVNQHVLVYWQNMQLKVGLIFASCSSSGYYCCRTRKRRVSSAYVDSCLPLTIPASVSVFAAFILC